MITVVEALSLLTLTPLEMQKIAKIESTIDDSIAREYSGGKMAGAPIRLEINDHVESKIAYAVARNYESRGNWRVHVASVAPLTMQFTPMIMPEALSQRAAVKTLPPIVRIEAPTGTASKRLLVRMPTRSRPKQALEVLAKYRSMAGCPITIEVVIDADDATMNDICVLQRLHTLGCVVTVGLHKSKVQAVNAGRVTEWDVLLLASDDMVPVKDGYAVRVLEEMEKHWPQLDGALYFDDGAQGAKLVTLPIIGRRWHEQMNGLVYHPNYQSLFCDTEQGIVWAHYGRLYYIDEKIIEHRHHVWGKSSNDDLYRTNDALWDADQKVFEDRKARNFDMKPIRLSICIVTIPARRAMLDLLVDGLYYQRSRRAHGGSVEIVIDGGDGHIGEKRQRLLERAKGAFIAFCDDDDLIAHDYIQRILDAIQSKPDADCVSLVGMMTTAGGVPEKFIHSLGHEWGMRDGTHYRSPNHLSPIRRELALKAGFPAFDHAEDHAYSMALVPLLKTEADSGAAPLYMYLFDPTKKEAAPPVP